MKGARLELTSTWLVGDQLGEGGFGRVFEVSGGDAPAVAKFVPRQPGADRELLFVNTGAASNVIPVIDSGEFEGHWVLVMPRAERSLREELEERSGVLDVEDALTVLVDIATALTDLDGSVVHRDLKPENVLLLDGLWCLADFGISRYAEASTAPDTHKWAMSTPYAAPERWRGDRATSAADIYALGVMGFEMLAGRRPFPGPTAEDFRDQHLHEEPPLLEGVPTALSTVLSECLFKAPAVRPSPANLRERILRQQADPPSGGLAALQAANQAEVRRLSNADRAASIAASAAEIRAERVAAGRALYGRIADTLRDAIVSAAPAATVRPYGRTRAVEGGGWVIQLGGAELMFTGCSTGSVHWGGWEPPAFALDAWGSVGVRIPTTRYGYEGRAHSLYFGDVQEQGQFGWYETAFMVMPLMGGGGRVIDPFDLDPGEEAAKALWNGVAEYQLAWPFTKLEPEQLDDFVQRWAGWFGAAANGDLNHPSSMPERRPEGSWRRA